MVMKTGGLNSGDNQLPPLLTIPGQQEWNEERGRYELVLKFLGNDC